MCAACVVALAAERSVDAQAAPLDSARAIALLRSTCGADAAGRGVGLLRGTVRDADTLAVESAAITIAWLRPSEVQPGGRRGATTTDTPVLAKLSDDEGRWSICGAPLHTALTIRAVADAGSDERIITLDDATPVAAVNFSLHTVAAAVKRRPFCTNDRARCALS